MKNWEEIVKEGLADERIPLPEGDWEWFESNKLQPFLRRRRLFRWSSGIAGLAVAASMALVFLMPSHRPSPETQSPTVSEYISSTSTSILKDSSVVCHIVERPSHTLVALGNDEPSTKVEIDPEQSFEYAEPIPDRTSQEDTKEYSTEGNYDDNQFLKHVETSHYTVAPLIRGIGGKTASSGYGLMISSSDLMNTTSDVSPGLPSVSHQIPITVGMELSVPLIPNLSLTSGADISLYRSRYSFGNNTLIQKAYYLGIPLRLDWTAWQSGPVSAWVGAGGKVDRLIYGTHGTGKIHDKSFNWSLTGSAGIQYELFPNVGLFLSPEMSYYLKPSDPAVLTYRTENPLMITVGAGLRIDL